MNIYLFLASDLGHQFLFFKRRTLGCDVYQAIYCIFQKLHQISLSVHPVFSAFILFFSVHFVLLVYILFSYSVHLLFFWCTSSFLSVYILFSIHLLYFQCTSSFLSVYILDSSQVTSSILLVVHLRFFSVYIFFFTTTVLDSARPSERK